ncbi:MAG: hypothetical protein PHY26_03520 [Bacilli bacterium]|nr:hypothetical protein [Bacilli bacterium]
MAELLPSRQDIIELCQNAVMNALDLTADKEHLINLEDEIDRDYEKLTIFYEVVPGQAVIRERKQYSHPEVRD